jgi:hypothetical protein
VGGALREAVDRTLLRGDAEASVSFRFNNTRAVQYLLPECRIKQNAHDRYCSSSISYLILVLKLVVTTHSTGWAD